MPFQVIDQNYFQSARELYLLIHPLRNCIYIAGALLRIGIATQLPSITILVYPKNANQVPNSFFSFEPFKTAVPVLLLNGFKDHHR
jgi:hypothetical protein